MPGNELFWFQQDGAPAHTAGKSLERIQEHFGPCVLSRLTDIPWPAHSPDLVLNDYYLCGLTILPPYQSVAGFKNLNCKCCSTHSTLAPLSTSGRIQLQAFLL